MNEKMSENRYNFNSVIDDDELAVLAAIAKDVLNNDNNIVSIFQKNEELLYGQSPRQVLFLMKLNNKSIFSSSPISESTSPITRSNQEQSTPVTRNPDASDLPRRCLPFEDAVKKLFNMETGTPVRSQSVIVSCKKKDTAIEGTAVGSTDSPGPSNQESPGSVQIAMMTGQLSMDEKIIESPTKMNSSPDTENQESPRSAELTKMTANLSVVEQDTNSGIVAVGDCDKNVSAQEFPLLVEQIKISPNLSEDEMESKSLVKDESFINLATIRDTVDIGENAEAFITPDSINKDSTDSSERTVKILEQEAATPSPVEKSKICNIDLDNTDTIDIGKNAESSITPDSINKDSEDLSEGTVKILEQEAGSQSPVEKSKMCNTDLATNTEAVNIVEKAGTPISSPDSYNKDSENLSEVTVKIPEQNEAETPSPAKKPKMGNISTTDIQEFPSSSEIDRLMKSSLDSIEVAVSPLKNDKTIISPKEGTAGISSDKKKRKSQSPKITSSLFKSIPRVIQARGESEMDVLVSGVIGGTTSLTTSWDSPTNYKRDLTELKNLVEESFKFALKDAPTDTFPKSNESHLSLQENTNSISPSGNVSEIKKPDNDSQALFPGLCSVDIPSTSATATEELPSKSKSNLGEVAAVPTAQDYIVRKFEDLLRLRQQTMERIFNFLLIFQNNLRFLNSYIDSIGYVVQQIGSKGQECASEELKEIVNDALFTTVKLKRKLGPWSIDVDKEVCTWYSFFQQIKKIEEKYGPISSAEGKPQASIEDLQSYEREIRVIWKMMDEMIMVGDSRKSLFSNTAHDFEMLLKMFVKCLTFVGILLP